MEPSRKQYEAIHTLRGISLVAMIIYHGLYNLVNIIGLPLPWFTGPWGYLFQQSICWTFIFLSGLCWSMGKKQLNRGVQLILCGALVSGATLLFMPEEAIRNGILTFMGMATLLMIPLEKPLNRIPALLGAPAAFSLFVITREISDGFLGFEQYRLISLPAELYRYDALAFLGLRPEDFYSADYFPLLPWFFLFCTGFFTWQLIKERPHCLRLLEDGIPVFSLAGKHSLPIYLLHQPILLGAMMLFSKGSFL